MTDEPTNEPNLTHNGEDENPTGAIPPIGESSPELAETPQAADAKPATSSVATAKRVATVGGRVVLGLAVAAIAVVGVAAATLAPPFTVTAERTPITAQPAAGNAVLGCSGPLLAIGRNAADAKQVSVAADAQYAASDARAAQGDVAITDVAGANSVLFSAPPQNDQRVNFAAAGSVSVASADLSGFAAYGCQPAVMQSWLVGAETLTGTTGIVTLSNPGDVTATVTITTFGLAGPVQTPGSQGIVVAPRTTVTVPVAALVAGQEAPVLRIDSHGTPVLANLQSGVVRTLVTGGVDVQSAIAVPSTVQTIPGVQISAAPQSGMTYTRVRLLATEHPTKATVTLQRVGSTAITYSVDVPLDGGIPASIDVPAQEAGTYVVTVKASEDVVAGVWTTTGYEAGSDFAWAVTAPTLRAGETPLAVPAGAGGSLVIVNTGTDTLQGKVTLAGSPTTVSLAAGQSLAVPAAGGATGTLTITSGEASAAVTFGANQAIATFPVWPADAAAKPVTVSR